MSTDSHSQDSVQPMEGVSMTINGGLDWGHPHAFHLNLPSHHTDKDGVPLITKHAHKRARYIMKLVESLKLTEAMFVSEGNNSNNNDNDNNNIGNNVHNSDDGNHNQDTNAAVDDMEVDNLNDEELEEEEEYDELQNSSSADNTLVSLIYKCTRLQSRLLSLESLKHCGLTKRELCEIVLRLMKLITATVTIVYSHDEQRKVTLHYENVGFICDGSSTDSPDESTQQDYILAKDTDQLEEQLSQKFALPTPAREVLLSIIINILSNKGPLRSVSNSSIYPEGRGKENRFLLILHWRSLLRMLLRTAPYLDEHKVGTAPSASNSRQNTILKRTVQTIRDARHFFDQGFRPPPSEKIVTDLTAREIWDLTKTDIISHSHTHACYRSLVILYLFQPSRCTSSYYLEVLPTWFDCWTNIDRCPEIDFLWLALFCRARKHLPCDFDWGPIRRRILTHSQYWLQLPIGGASMDKSFPRPSTPRSRSIPSRLKVFAGTSSSYEEGIDFVAKVAKLLVISLGTGATSDNISEGTKDVLRFLSFVTPYFHPSNLGSWTFTLGAFLHYFCYELCCRMGTTSSMRSLEQSNPSLVEALCKVEASLKVVAIPSREVVALMDALLPLCQQALYSKNGHVGRAGEAAMLYLSQIDPARVTPSFIDFATRALDITAVNLAHQAPAALSALTRLLQPALRSKPSILLARLPDILRLTLAGIDSNDQNKTIRTLILYRSLTSWVPVGGLVPSQVKIEGAGITPDGTFRVGNDMVENLYTLTNSAEYVAAVDKLQESSLLKQGSALGEGDLDLLTEEAMSALSDWVLEFLERIYALLRASGEREKAGKTSSGVASRHSSVDVQQARNFSRVLRECLMQTFASMSDNVHSSAVKSVVRFLSEETLPSAAKDASFLCQAAAAVRVKDGKAHSPGLDAIIPIVIDDLEHNSNKTVMYRLRCMAGAVKSCSHALIAHRSNIMHAIDFALASKDKHIYKTGCKLLRHTVATLCESYPLACDVMPRSSPINGRPISLGKSAQLHEDPVQWHVPDAASIQFAWELLEGHVLKRIKDLVTKVTANTDATTGDGNVNGNEDDAISAYVDVPELRRTLRVVRYSLRGGASILLDFEDDTQIQQPDVQPDDLQELDFSPFPFETAMKQLLRSCSPDLQDSIFKARGRLCSFVISLSSLIASETSKKNTTSVSASSDRSTSPLPPSIEAAAAATATKTTTTTTESLPPSDTTAAEGTSESAVPSDRKYLALISTDTKICKEVCDISLLLLTRRGAHFRSQEGKTIWKAQKQLATDFALLAEADHISESLQRSSLYGDSSRVFFKDGEDAGKTIPRRLLVARVQLFHDSLHRTASFEVPRRLRRLSKVNKITRRILFSSQSNINDTITTCQKLLDLDPPSPLDGYEGLLDGLFSLCSHSNTQVRASGIGVVDYAITRFGWLVKPRIPRLLSALRLEDKSMQGKFGLPSCEMLIDQVDGQGKRKRLAEVLKGVCSILALPRAGKQFLGSERTQFDYIKTICSTDDLVSMVPPEEMQKMVHYLHSIFNPFRSKFYSVHRATKEDQRIHEDSIFFLLDILQSDQNKMDNDEGGAAKAAHWRKLLLVCWFLTALVDKNDLELSSNDLAPRLWKCCFQVLENEAGQPLQRVALGLFGRLVMMIGPSVDGCHLREQMVDASFCRVLGNALVYDHKEDSSVGGGHDAQWSAGVADIIRDSARNIAPKSLFPFQRTNQGSGTFKIAHAQLLESILLILGKEKATISAQHLLTFAKEMAASPPSEDQRNQQCTSAEIFAGVARSFLQLHSVKSIDEVWTTLFLPYLDEVVPKIPISLSGSYFDAVRYAIQFSPSTMIYSFTSWLCDKIESTLWQPKAADDSDISITPSTDNKVEGNPKNGSQGSDGFTAQSKWLYLCCAVLVELDEAEEKLNDSFIPLYAGSLVDNFNSAKNGQKMDVSDVNQSWKLLTGKLLPRLVEALGHPYESCRDHIAGCLFRICYCHRRISRGSSFDATDQDKNDMQDPGVFIVEKLGELASSNEGAFQVRYNALITARRFFAYCIHFGDAKHEYTDYLIPLLPLAFESLKSTIEDGGDTAESDTVARRTLEAEVVKGYRYTIAEVSVASVISHGRNHDISRVLDAVEKASVHEYWQVRHASAHFLRCFQGSHKFLFTAEHADKITSIVAGILADDRREVSSAAMAAVTGIIAALPTETVGELVKKYVTDANKSTMKRKKKSTAADTSELSEEQLKKRQLKEEKRLKTQQSSVFFLCAVVLSQPYDTPPYVPVALAAISKHSFERNAPLGVRDTVKKCCAEYKRTHMSDNWEVHRQAFTTEQLEALDDVVSSPHYYA